MRATNRGLNQSVGTKFATSLVDEAITVIQSGRVQHGVDMLRRAIMLLPDIGGKNQQIEVAVMQERKARF